MISEGLLTWKSNQFRIALSASNAFVWMFEFSYLISVLLWHTT